MIRKFSQIIFFSILTLGLTACSTAVSSQGCCKDSAKSCSKDSAKAGCSKKDGKSCSKDSTKSCSKDKK